MNQTNNTLIIGPSFVDFTIFTSFENSVLTTNSTTSLGGKGYNIAKALPVFGLQPTLATVLAHDDLGSMITQSATLSGIIIDKYSYQSEYTPSCCIVIDSSGKTSFEKVDTSFFPTQTIGPIDHSVEQVVILSSANDQIWTTLIDTKKSRPELKIFLSIAGRKSIANILGYLPQCDTIFANRKEAEELMKLLDISGTLEDLIRHLLNIGLNRVVLTLDTDGVVAGQKTKELAKIYKLPICNTYTTEIVSTVGAGDSFLATFVASSSRFDFEHSIQNALEVAAFHIRTPSSSLVELPAGVASKFKN